MDFRQIFLTADMVDQVPRLPLSLARVKLYGRRDRVLHCIPHRSTRRSESSSGPGCEAARRRGVWGRLRTRRCQTHHRAWSEALQIDPTSWRDGPSYPQHASTHAMLPCCTLS